MSIYGRAITAGGGGSGNNAFIYASFPSQTTSYSLTKDGKSFRAVESDSTHAVYSVTQTGTYTFTSSTTGMIRTIDVIVNNLHRQYTTATAYDLASASWVDISNVAKAGVASNYWAVGDTKMVSVDGVSYSFAIMGFDNYDVADSSTYGRAKNGITFGMVDCMNTKKYMNSSDTNTGGWGSSKMKTTCNGFALDSDLSSVITYVRLPYCATHNSATLSYDTTSKLFLPSYAEIFGNGTYQYQPKSKEGSQFAYYINGGSKIKKVSGSASSWWERSVCSDNSDLFCGVGTSGGAVANTASDTRGVAPCFCV